MQLRYKNPWVERLAARWTVFEEQARRITPYLQCFGFRFDRAKYLKIPDQDKWKFSAFFKSSSRIIHLSLTTNLYQDGAVSFFIYPLSSEKVKGISFYKYLRKHFKMVPRYSLFLSRSSGDFSQRLDKVFTTYARMCQFYMQSILQGTRWEEDKSD